MSDDNRTKMEDAMQHMATIAHNTLVSRIDSLPDPHSKYKSCAAVVMVENDEFEYCSVVTVCTGDKILSGRSILGIKNGLVDCHAEVVARRALIYYLCNHLKLAVLRNSECNLFEPAGDSGGKYKLKSSIKFYLFVNSAPCGDSEVLLNDPVDSDNKQSAGNSKLSEEGIMRMKKESQDGIFPTYEYKVERQAVQHIRTGDPLMVMSCSDKIMQWNVLGMQSNLLFCFLTEPIYFAGIGINTNFHLDSCKRAFYGRIDNGHLKIQPPFKLNKIEIYKTSFGDCKGSSDFSVNWILGQVGVEIVTCETGLQVNEKSSPSRLCKLSFFHLFVSLYPCFLTGRLTLKRIAWFNYMSTKETNTNYAKAKREFLNAVETSGLNNWVLHAFDMNVS